MFRKLGLLAVACFMVVSAEAASAGQTLIEPSATALEVDAPAAPAATPAKAEANKGMKPRPYAVELQKKLKKPGPPPSKPKFKPWDEIVTKDHKKVEGLLTLHTKGAEVLLELKKDDLDKPMLAILSLSQGIGSNFVYGGLPIDDVMFDFHRDEDNIQLRRLTANFRAEGDEELQKAIDLTFAESILESFPIKTEREGKVIIEVKDFFLSDVAGMSIWLNGALSQPMRLEAKKGYFGSIKNYPTNTEIDTRLTYAASRPEALFRPNFPDPRAIQVGVAWSIRKLPEEPMTPRIADDRVGYFTTSFKDFTKEKTETFFTHYANRWRLEKKDPAAAVSEPKQQIVYYIDHTVPKEYVPYMIAGVNMWQKAFEAAGFKEAIVGKPAPTKEEDPNYDPVDARYNTIRWNVSDQVSYGAIGPSRVDPRTGEIIDADILFEHNIVHNFGKSWRRVAAPRPALMEVDHNLKQLWMTPEEREREEAIMSLPFFKGRPYMLCSVNDCMGLGAEMMRLTMLINGMIEAGQEVPMEYIGAALTFVSAHEVGHTIGLRHNFKSSGAVPYDQLNDKAKIDQIGMTGSVMDYPTPNIAANASQQGYYYTPIVGTYDMWAIEWAYKPIDGATPEEQSKNLEAIARKCVDKAYLYGTDEDTYPMGALDPRSNTNDLSDDPMRWANERMSICNDLLMKGQLEGRVVAEGGDYVPLRAAVQALFVQKYVCSNIATKTVGGAYTERAHKGDGKAPFTLITADEQRKALQFVVDNALKSNAYALSPDMLNKMQDDKMWSWENNLFQQGRRFDFPLSDWVEAMQTGVLFNVMNPFLQARVVDNAYKNNSAFKLSDLYSTLTKSIWTDNLTPNGRTATWDRNLQRVYTDMLIQQMVEPYPVTPQDAVSLSRLNLTRIKTAAQSGLQRKGLDDETNAHLMETIARVDRALNASREANF
ncbi:MAG TPA: zinc-dependent metalloprotease [Candidatus Krumholzibacteria bacterium]|nr:zinc-dependent metalloprotease [Candidatus Krumholzibacteria bacterium]